MIPGLSRKSATPISPLRTASTASPLQSGHNDRVFLGTPVSIGMRSRCLRSRLGAQLGMGKWPSGKALLISRSSFQTAFAVALKAAAFDLNIRIPPEGQARGERETCSESGWTGNQYAYSATPVSEMW